MEKFSVTVFGGAQPQPGSPVYEEGLRLGRLLGKQGWTVLTGGYMGTMESVSRGASENGSHVIGVTCSDIEKWRGSKANPWVAEEIKLPNLRERMLALIDRCDAAIALPGGIGTLTEIMMTWNQLLVQTIKPRPLILIGAGWKNVIESLFTEMGVHIPESQRQWVRFAESAENAVIMLQEFTAGGKV